MPRLFFAVELPPELKKNLVELQDALAGRLGALHPTPNCKPEMLANAHCTLRFLGTVEEVRIDALSECVSRAIVDAAIMGFSASLAKCGTFANRGKTRVLWIALQPEASFQKLHRAIDSGIHAAGIPFEAEDAFYPHLTLFRFREPYRLPTDFKFPDLADQSPSAMVSEVLLIESKTLPSGPVHTIRRRFVLR